MKRFQRIVRVVALGISLAVAASACSAESTEGYSGHGIVKSVEADARKVTLDHEDIAGLMKAMTMTFNVAPGVSLETLQPGASVDFKVKEERGTYTVTEIRQSGS